MEVDGTDFQSEDRSSKGELTDESENDSEAESLRHGNSEKEETNDVDSALLDNSINKTRDLIQTLFMNRMMTDLLVDAGQKVTVKVMHTKIMCKGEDLDLDHPDHHVSQGHDHILNCDPDPHQI